MGIMDEYLKTEDVMELLGVSRKTVYALVGKGLIERRKVGRNNLYPVESIRAYINGQSGK